MLFHCTLVRGPASPPRQEAVELTVEVDDGGPGSAVQAAVAARFQTGALTVAGLPLSSLAVGKPPLMPGAVLVEGAAFDVVAGRGSEDQAVSPSFLKLLVHSGPCAGMVVPLERGCWPIGRGSCGIAIPDPDMSREHAALTVSETEILLSDTGSSNGTTVDGRKVSRAIISTGSVIRCGASTMTVAFGAAPSASLQYAGTGPGDPIRLPRRQDPGSRLVMALTAGLPLLLGIGLAVVTGMWMFLAFTAVSAVAVLLPLVSGRKERKAFKTALSSAIAHDQRRREGAAPSAADIVLAVSPGRSRAERSLDRDVGSDGSPETERGSDARMPVWLRIGTGQQEARISPEPSDPHFAPPVLDRCPVLLDPARRSVTISGPPARVAGLFNFLLMQLAAFPLASSAAVLIHGAPGALPLSARFLPRAMLSSDRSTALEAIRAAGDRPGYLFLPCPAGQADPAVREAAAAAGWAVLQQTGADGLPADIELGTGRALLRDGLRELPFDPDLVPPATFDLFCRTAARSADLRSRPAAGLPDSCYLGDLLDWDSQSIRIRWKDAEGARALPAPIGCGHRGTQQLDLADDGPHLLIAGTTGSGKSELLRTIVAAVSLGHSPDHVTFLFVDFKGGSGLGPLAQLPHCVGLLTDLGRHGLERALASLRAEVRYREQLLADAGVQDFTSYRQARRTAAKEGLRAMRSVLPRLVIVVDEFRMLIEDFPSALSELMRIATVGRSLGIHLVMATQRPQGAISSDIRANVTTSISLRVQSEMESHDVIGSSEAAGIPVSLPGRAYFSKGSERKQIFQAASLSGPVGPSPRKVVAHDAFVLLQNPQELADKQHDAAISESNGNPAGARIPIIESIREAWQELDGSSPRRPVAGELPDKIQLTPGTLPCGPGRHTGTRPFAAYPGIVDRPEKQSTESLLWHPPAHGHLALLGPTGSGVEAACLTVSSQLLTSATDVHCYILDGDGSFPAGKLPGQVGALATLQDPRRGVRIAERVAAELAKRQGQATGAEPQVPLLLIITAWGAWLSLFRSGPLAWAEDLIHGVIRDGQKSGIHVLITGDRELSASRLFAALPNRAYFPFGSTEEGRMAWPRFSPLKSIPGRAMVSGPLLGEGLAEAQFAEPPWSGRWPYGRTPDPDVRPFRVEPLPQKLTPEETLARSGSLAQSGSSGRATAALLLGLGGDDLHPVSADLPPGGVLLVLGHRGSGKTSLLAALPVLNPGLPWLEPGSDAGRSGFCSRLYQRASAGAVAPGTTVLIDDIDKLGDEEAAKAAELPGLGLRVVATAAYSTGLLQRVPLAIQSRNEGRGILLSPRNVTDGEIFGVRVEPGQAVPGRAVLLQDGEARLFQIPYADRSLNTAA